MAKGTPVWGRVVNEEVNPLSRQHESEDCYPGSKKGSCTRALEDNPGPQFQAAFYKWFTCFGS